MTFLSETTVKSVRKQRPCDGCGSPIEVGQTAVRWAGVDGGEIQTNIYHPECREAELALNKRIGTWSDDDWIMLYDMDREDRAWLIAEHPLAAARRGIVMEPS